MTTVTNYERKVDYNNYLGLHTGKNKVHNIISVGSAITYW
jgi:hypothetical protein